MFRCLRRTHRIGFYSSARRYFLDNVAEYILELDRGEGFPFKGNYSGFLEKKMARLELDAKIDNKRKASLKKELEVRLFWARGGVELHFGPGSLC